MYTVVITRFIEPWHKVWSIYNAFSARMASTGTAWKMIVYNRRQEDAAGCEWQNGHPKPENVHVRYMENVGREAYVILKYIHEHYDELDENSITAFIPANWDSFVHRTNAINAILNMTNQNYLPEPEHYPMNVWRNFTLDEWYGYLRVGGNYEEVVKQGYTKSSSRPFGKWYATRIPVPFADKATFSGTFAVVNKNILRYSKNRYKTWAEEIAADGVNSELAHYWERTWYSIFC